ncbi:CHAD domain-containing protein [Methanolapillus millepedarum]|uniref:CHAD domain-containing protein n=1 Tax=Methanolapillus millepedarum TaxID=3028296 RepID=A0AA96V4R2_9EURY|nr:hypothetical protein MsAc7_10670 [Methanosarcinaceae archaeon Ac7]
MEIEYKFGVLKPETHDFLKTISKTGSFTIETGNPAVFSDTFYDTPDFLLLSVGYYLRAREEKGADEIEWTLKSRGDRKDGVHKRMEAKQTLPKNSAVKDISNPDFLKKLTFAIGDFDLIPVLTIGQERMFRNVKTGVNEQEQVLAEMAVDCVYLKIFDQTHTFFELEIELKNGTEGDLKDFVNTIKSEPLIQNNIRTNYLSKFERGLILYFNRDKIDGRVNPALAEQKYSIDSGSESVFDTVCPNFLQPSEKAALIQICEKDYSTDFSDYFGKNGLFGNDSDVISDVFQFKASMILALDSGLSVNFAAQKYKTSPEDIVNIYQAFLSARLSLFPFVFESAENPAFYLQKPISDSKTWTAEELAVCYGADISDIRIVKARSENMSYWADFFAGDRSTKSEAQNRILNHLAVLSGIGQGISIERDGNVIRDIILTHPLKETTLNELKMMSLAFILENIKSPSELKIKNAIQNAGFFVPPALQRKALVDASFLQIVNRLEKEKASIREIVSVERSRIEETDDSFELNLETENEIFEMRSGFTEMEGGTEPAYSVENETADVKKDISEFEKMVEIYYTADKKTKPKKGWSSLFNFVFGIPVRFIQVRSGAYEKDGEKLTFDQKISANEKKKAAEKISCDDIMANASEKIFLTQLREVIKCEPGVIEGKEIEAVHDMRVALRKMRSSVTIFYEFLDPAWISKTEDNLKKTLSPLGKSRDLDVLLEKTDAYLKNKNIQPARLNIFYELVAADKEKAHEAVADYLNSDDYSTFKNKIQKTLTKGQYIGIPAINKKGDVAPSRVADVLPQVLYEKAAGITAYHEWLDGPFISIDKLHRLRIAAKNFRYTLDFFKDCLGDTAVKLTKEFKELQDILGDFHDAVVAVDAIENYIRRLEEMKRNLNSGENEKEVAEFESVLAELLKYKTYREEEIESLLLKFRGVWKKMDRKFFHERISKIIEESGF